MLSWYKIGVDDWDDRTRVSEVLKNLVSVSESASDADSDTNSCSKSCSCPFISGLIIFWRFVALIRGSALIWGSLFSLLYHLHLPEIYTLEPQQAVFSRIYNSHSYSRYGYNFTINFLIRLWVHYSFRDLTMKSVCF